jgi:hypothetical protein
MHPLSVKHLKALRHGTVKWNSDDDIGSIKELFIAACFINILVN